MLDKKVMQIASDWPPIAIVCSCKCIVLSYNYYTTSEGANVVVVLGGVGARTSSTHPWVGWKNLKLLPQAQPLDKEGRGGVTPPLPIVMSGPPYNCHISYTIQEIVEVQVKGVNPLEQVSSGGSGGASLGTDVK